MKIKRDLGHLEGHWLVGVYELEDGRCICVDRGKILTSQNLR